MADLLDEIYRQYGLTNPNAPAAQALPAQPRPAPAIPPLSPQEEEGVLSHLGSGALGGLAYLGGSLGKAFGGRAIRGLLGGRPEELASVIPFSDALGITNPENEVRGSDLLGGNKDTSFLSPEGVGGLGLEVLLDPATYLTFGGSALTAAGRAAQKAGTLAKGTRAGIAAGQRGLVGLGLPFAHPSAVLGTGQAGLSALDTAAKVAGKIPGANALYENVLSPAGRGIASLFDKSTAGTITSEGQAAARSAYDTLQTGLPQARQQQLDVLKLLDQHGALGKGPELARYVEGGFGPFQAGIPEAGDLVKQQLGGMIGKEQALGSPIEALQDYLPRYQTQLEKDTKGFSSSKAGLSAMHPSLLGREEILDLPGGRAGVNALAADQEIKGLMGSGSDMARRNAISTAGQALPPELAGVAPNALEPARLVRERYLGGSAAEDATRLALSQKSAAGQLTDPAEAELLKALQGKYDQSIRLADWVRTLDPQYAGKGLDFFGNHPATDFLSRAVYHQRATANMEAIHDMLAATAKPAAEAGGDSIPMAQALAQLGLGKEGKASAGALQTATDRLMAAGKINNPAQLNGMFVPQKIVEDAGRFGRAMQAPEALQGFLRQWDSITNLTKTFQTSMYPAFHTRNAMSGAFMNWVTGFFSPKLYKDALDLRKGGVIQDANRIPGLTHLSPEQATRQVAEWGHNYGLTGNPQGLFADLVGAGEHAAQQQIPRLPGPGNVQQGPLEAYLGGFKGLASGEKGALNPLAVQGVYGQNVDKFALAKGGKETGQAVEEMNRMSGFIGRLRQGYSPDVAAAEAKATHYDYGSLSPFERGVMKRVIPFYSWMRLNTPFVLNQVLEKPGGKMAVAIKGSGEARGKEPGFLPDYLGQGLGGQGGRAVARGNAAILHQHRPALRGHRPDLHPLGDAGLAEPASSRGPLETLTGRQSSAGGSWPSCTARPATWRPTSSS
jgi:hypothetical protein